MKANIVKAKTKIPSIVINAYGGTAATYSMYDPLSEPYKENNATYIDISYKGSIKKVRWYSDEAHHSTYKFHSSIPKKPLWSLFFFENERDYIQIIKEPISGYDPNDSYTREYHQKMVANGWTYRDFFGGAWLAHKDAKLPNGVRANIEICDWQRLKKAGQEHLEKYRYNNNRDGVWFEED